jgi:hypothetical protein
MCNRLPCRLPNRLRNCNRNRNRNHFIVFLNNLYRNGNRDFFNTITHLLIKGNIYVSNLLQRFLRSVSGTGRYRSVPVGTIFFK